VDGSECADVVSAKATSHVAATKFTTDVVYANSTRVNTAKAAAHVTDSATKMTASEAAYTAASESTHMTACKAAHMSNATSKATYMATTETAYVTASESTAAPRICGVYTKATAQDYE
jgi:hypothetical protein